MKEHHVVLSLGSNCGDRMANVREAAGWIVALLYNVRFSTLYETEEIHGAGSPYYNAVISGKCELSYERLNSELKQYEISRGRDDEARKMNIVPIDIDIVIWDDDVLRPSDYAHSFFQRGYRQLSDRCDEP